MREVCASRQFAVKCTRRQTHLYSLRVPLRVCLRVQHVRQEGFDGSHKVCSCRVAHALQERREAEWLSGWRAAGALAASTARGARVTVTSVNCQRRHGSRELWYRATRLL